MFQYLKMLQTLGPQQRHNYFSHTPAKKTADIQKIVLVGNVKVIFLSVSVHTYRIYEEIQKIEANEFHYQEQVRIQIFMGNCIRCNLT